MMILPARVVGKSFKHIFSVLYDKSLVSALLFWLNGVKDRQKTKFEWIILTIRDALASLIVQELE